MDCAICLTLPNNPKIVPCCSQTFCIECLNQWVAVKNCCPLCIAPLGVQLHNHLNKQESTQFDNGGLMLQGELAIVLQKFNFLKIIYQSKQATANNYKSNFPKASLSFVKKEMQNVQQNIQIAQLSISEGDRVTATTTIQNIAQTLFDVEAILMGETTVEFEDDYYSDEEDDYQDNYDYEMEEQLYCRRDKEKHKATSKANGKKRVHELMN